MKRFLIILLLPAALIGSGCFGGTQPYELDTPEGAISEYLRVQAEGDVEGFCRVLSKDSQVYLLLSLGAGKFDCVGELQARGEDMTRVMNTTAEYLRLKEIKRIKPGLARAYFDSSKGLTTRDLVFERGLWRVEFNPGS